MKKNVPLYKIPLATTLFKGKIVLFSKIIHKISKNENARDGSVKLVFTTSTDGLVFSDRSTEVSIFRGKKELMAAQVRSLKIFLSEQEKSKKSEYTMLLEVMGETGIDLHTAFSFDLKKWLIRGSQLSVPFGRQALYVPKIKGRPKTAVYYSDKEVWVQVKNGSLWHPAHIVINPRLDAFDSQPLEAIACIPEESGFFIPYSSQSFSGNSVDMSVGGIICSYTEPGKVLWRSSTPLWQGHFDKAEYLIPIGGVFYKKNIFLYWMDIHTDIIVVKIEKKHSGPLEHTTAISVQGPLKRSKRNPIITPRGDQEWEIEGTFNPAAFEDDHGTVHLLYRAIGRDGISRIGHAQSRDGIHFKKRSSGPVFEPKPGFGLPHPESVSGPMKYNPLLYTSGGSWGGSEDPRTVKIGNTVYMTYVAFEGWNSIRIAMTSIAAHDLEQGHWKWKKPVLISAPGEINKNWLLFSEKIKGKYAVLHSIAPSISIAYVDGLDDFDGSYFISSERPQGPQPGRARYWDSLLRGAGPPPLKTDEGWLLLYHAIDRNDTGRYKLGAMILDLKNPEKILYRANNPLLAPDMTYENEGKAGVIYASGAIIRDTMLYIYYGGGDRVVCVAKAPLSDFLEFVKKGKAPELAFSRITIN